MKSFRTPLQAGPCAPLPMSGPFLVARFNRPEEKEKYFSALKRAKAEDAKSPKAARVATRPISKQAQPVLASKPGPMKSAPAEPIQEKVGPFRNAGQAVKKPASSEPKAAEPLPFERATDPEGRQLYKALKKEHDRRAALDDLKGCVSDSLIEEAKKTGKTADDVITGVKAMADKYAVKDRLDNARRMIGQLFKENQS